MVFKQITMIYSQHPFYFIHLITCGHIKMSQSKGGSDLKTKTKTGSPELEYRVEKNAQEFVLILSNQVFRG